MTRVEAAHRAVVRVLEHEPALLLGEERRLRAAARVLDRMVACERRHAAGAPGPGAGRDSGAPSPPHGASTPQTH